MSTITRIVLCLLLVLFLFAGLLAWHWNQDDSDKPTLGAFFSKLTTSFSPDQPLSASDVIGVCFSNGTFRVQAALPCTLLIRSSDAHIRTLSLKLSAGSKAQVSLASHGETGVSISAPLHSGGTLKLQVMSDGAQLTLTCASPPSPALPCQFGLLP